MHIMSKLKWKSILSSWHCHDVAFMPSIPLDYVSSFISHDDMLQRYVIYDMRHSIHLK